MRAKTLILLFVALGCGMIAAVAVSKVVMDKNPTATQAEATTEIFVALKDLPSAKRISAENVKLEKWPKSRVPEGALYSLEQVEDKFTRQTIFANEPLLDRKISDTRSSFATKVPPGYRVFDIACKAGYIKAGDHVDILGTFQPGGRNSLPESRTVMRNVVVCGVNGNAMRDEDEDGMSGSVRDTLFQLQVKDSQIEALTLANSMGSLQLHLRPFEDDDDGFEDTGRDFLDWLEDRGEEAKQDELLVASTEVPSQPTLVRNTMSIITPDSVTTYEWTNDDELPQRVSTSGGSPYSASGGAQDSSGNVYSGYGGYEPTYPTSTEPSASQEGGAPPATGESTTQASEPQEEIGLN